MVIRGGRKAVSGTLLLISMISFATSASAALRNAGALAFSPEGVLFIGDNASGAIYAYAMARGTAPTSTAAPLEVDNIGDRIADALGVPSNEVAINGMAVHPVTQDVYLSVSRGYGDGMLPAVVRVTPEGKLFNVDLQSMQATEFKIHGVPSDDKHFRNRSKDWPVPAAVKYDAKAQIPVRTLTIVDMKFHNGELYVSGISNEEFASTLRRIPYPFTEKAIETKIRMYHIAHTRFETRAPIRAMQFATIDGVDTLIAAYTCSPLVLIPVASLRDGAKVTGKTIGDMGNGQPVSMFRVNVYGQDSLFVTNMGHGPRIIPLAGLNKATEYTPTNSPKGYPSDLSPEYPIGPVGKSVMFVGASLHADAVNDKFLVSLTRDAESGSLNLEALPVTPLPMKLDRIWSEFDFPGGGPNGS